MDSNINDEKDIYVPKDVMTGLPNGGRTRKDDLRMEGCGTIDELNSFLGLLISNVPISFVDELRDIQRKLFAIGAYLVGYTEATGLPTDADVVDLRQRCEDFQRQGANVHSFILPGGSHSASLAHVCRSVCRRAERTAVALEAYPVVPYLNRLSGFLFYFALYLNKFHNVEEIKL